MLIKKILFALTIAVSACSAMADNPPVQDAGRKEFNLEERKAKILQRIDQHISKMQSARACVSAAASREDLQKCKPERPARMRDGGKHGDDRHGPGETGVDDRDGF